MNRKNVEIVIPELHLRYYHAMSKLPWTTYSRKLLAECNRQIEAHVPLRSYFNSDWSIREHEVASFVRDHERGVLKNVGTYHGMIGIAPPHRPQNAVFLGNLSDYDKNVRAIAAQIKLVRQLSDGTHAPRALLVFHLDNSVCPENHDSMTKIISNQFKENMQLAAEQRVQISLEIDVMNGFSNCFGYTYENVAAVAETINAWCKTQNIDAHVGITMDLSHTLINMKGDFKAARKAITTYAHLINYAHINHPQVLPTERPAPHSSPYPKYFARLRVPVRITGDADKHGKIYDVETEEESEELIKLLIQKTGVVKTGVINLELSPKPIYLHNYFRGGARAKETYNSIKFLDRIIDEA